MLQSPLRTAFTLVGVLIPSASTRVNHGVVLDMNKTQSLGGGQVIRSSCYSFGNDDLTCGKCVAEKTYWGGEDCVWCVNRDNYLQDTASAVSGGTCQTRGSCTRLGSSWTELVPSDCLGIGADGEVGFGLGSGLDMCSSASNGDPRVKLGTLRWPVQFTYGDSSMAYDLMGAMAGSQIPHGHDATGRLIGTVVKFSLQAFNHQMKKWSEEGDEADEGTKEVRFLPKILNSIPVLLSEGDGMYRADPTEFKPDSLALGYRNSKNLDNFDPRPGVIWGNAVQGVDEGDGWVKVEVWPMDSKMDKRAAVAAKLQKRPEVAHNLLVYSARAPIAEQLGYEALHMRECPDSSGKVTTNSAWDGGSEIFGELDDRTIVTPRGERHYFETRLIPEVIKHVRKKWDDGTAWTRKKRNGANSELVEWWMKALGKETDLEWCAEGKDVPKEAVSKAMIYYADSVETRAKNQDKRVSIWQQSEEYRQTWAAVKGYLDTITLPADPPHVMAKRFYTNTNDVYPYRPYDRVTRAWPISDYETTSTHPTQTFRMTSSGKAVMRLSAGDLGVLTTVPMDWNLNLVGLAEDLLLAMGSACCPGPKPCPSE